MTHQKPGKHGVARMSGVCCPHCNSRWCPVKYTRHAGKVTIRKRVCQHCGTVFGTREKVE